MRGKTVLEFTPETRRRWEWSPDDIRRVGHLVVDLIAHHLTSLLERPVFRPFPPELAEHFLDAAVPLAGQEPEGILAAFSREVVLYAASTRSVVCLPWPQTVASRSLKCV